MHANAEIGYNTLCTRQIWIDLIELQPRSASGSGDVSRETFVMSVISDIEKKIPSPFPRHIIREEIGVPTPTQVVLLQELERWNNLVLRMSSSLIDLRRALIGEIGMSAELEELMNSIFNGQLPSMWLAYVIPSLFYSIVFCGNQNSESVNLLEELGGEWCGVELRIVTLYCCMDMVSYVLLILSPSVCMRLYLKIIFLTVLLPLRRRI